MKFQAKVIPSGNATAVEVPADVMKALGSGSRPLIAVTINGHAWRSRVALMRGNAPSRDQRREPCRQGNAAMRKARPNIVIVLSRLDGRARERPRPSLVGRPRRCHG